MAFFFNDHIHTNSFTPREHQVELLYSAKERNIIICLGKIAEQTFITTKLIQELSIDNRKSLSDHGKRTIYLLQDEQSCDDKATHIEHITDLKVLRCINVENFNSQEFSTSTQVLILTVEVCCQLLISKKIFPNQINLLVIDKCHNLVTNNELSVILDYFRSCDNSTKIIGFAVPLYSLTQEPGQLSFEIERIESLLQCQIETASDLLSILRYSPKPKEYLLAYKIEDKTDVENYIKECVSSTVSFLEDHRYDPTEIYSDEFLEDIKKIPNPVDKPLELIKEFLYILETLGPWAADRAALILLQLLEKLKIKTPYERHYLLLSVITTLFIRVRAYCDSVFNGLTDAEKIIKYSTSKIHRLIEVLKTFTPPIKEEKVQQNQQPKEQNNQEKAVKNFPGFRKPRPFRHPRGVTDPDLLCGVIFVDNTITAKILFYLLHELSKSEENFRFLHPLYTTERTTDDIFTGRDLELEHRKQEEVLKKFRIHECNLLISTSILEEGIDIPKCNFVMRFDFPKNYQSYVQCKSRARAIDALHVVLVPDNETERYVSSLAHYHYIEKILLAKCSSKEAHELDEVEADAYNSLIPEYKPLKSAEAPRVTLNSAISLINRYCAKLPSDTFTKLTPEWKIIIDEKSTYKCILRLPINSPLKYPISSYPMPNRALAKRIAALHLCVRLHKESEIDDYLMPVGKENFKANPEDAEVPALPGDEKMDLSEARPGTTKRRQYYYKKVANALTDCKPEASTACYLYHINMVLSCPLPEEQNTRGRKIYPPEESAIGFGILTRKKIPKVCPFPIYTRSGEVRVDLKLSKETVILDEKQIDKVVSFLNYTFTNVLRLQKYLMLFDPNVSENSYIIVPVKRSETNPRDICLDWDFLECIYSNRNSMPNVVSVDERKKFKFDPSKYHDAVIMPWYRNQDQPQYFYVAEICHHLNPKSTFPGADYSTFEEYYLKKYGIQIQNLEQPLLDVDHTSARLNFLTPRYVNRKGVALPTSSEETKRAKRENLEQKQILIAELCAIHPFPASLWRQAVCLPCILYRINALLLADQIRRQVAQMINLGQETLDENFEWQPLDFGWSLADVLKKSKENEKAKENEKIKEIEKVKEGLKIEEIFEEVEEGEKDKTNGETKKDGEIEGDGKSEENSKKLDEPKEEQEVKEKSENNGDCFDELEIGTWSNEMVNMAPINTNNDFNWGNVRYGSPTYESDFDDDGSDNTCSDDYVDDSDDDSDNDEEGLTIAYTGDNVAEAIDKKDQLEKEKLNIEQLEKSELMKWNFKSEEDDELYKKHRETHIENVKINEEKIIKDGIFISSDSVITFERKTLKVHVQQVERKYEDYVTKISETFVNEVVNSSTETCNKQVPATTSNQNLNPTEITFSFDYQPDLNGHSGPSPSLILQALTMSNANDGINLERLETIGDSFLKYAITTYLFCAYNNIHEGKLSHLRSKQVSNLNLYRLGRQKMLGESMIATKFEPHDNWLPPCYYVPKELEQALIESGIPSAMWNQAQEIAPRRFNEIDDLVRDTEQKLEIMKNELVQQQTDDPFKSFIPYNLITQHSIPDKSIADCVEALIGAYLIACGPRGALLFMSWLGIHVLPTREIVVDEPENKPPGSTPYIESMSEDGKIKYTHIRYEKLKEPPSPLFYNMPDAENYLKIMLDGYEVLEKSIGYRFRDKSYLLQAFTHASYQPNDLTDCYQRLEFLGDAVLDYLITRHLYEDPRQHSPGALTDLRSALVNNTIFASLAVRCGFHKYFRHLSPGLNTVIDRFVRIQEENGHSISEEYYLIGEKEFDEAEEAEDVEVPKALGDVFESLAGAIYLDSNMSLDAVWNVYFKIMKSEIEQFSANVPKSPIRELLELEPETAKFGRPEKLADGRRVRVTVDVFNKGLFKGIGRNYRIAKCTAAKCALKKLKKMQNYGKSRK